MTIATALTAALMPPWWVQVAWMTDVGNMSWPVQQLFMLPAARKLDR
jgi:hypothetical protein